MQPTEHQALSYGFKLTRNQMCFPFYAICPKFSSEHKRVENMNSDRHFT